MMEIKFDNKQKVVFAAKEGLTSYANVIELINEAVAVGIKHNCLSILFNMQKLTETFSFLEEYILNEYLLKNTDLTIHHRCAVIYSPKDSREPEEIKFKQTVADNWGHDIFKIFHDLNAGLNWLKTIHNNKN